MDNKCDMLMNLCFVPFASHTSMGCIARPGAISNVIGMYEKKKNLLDLKMKTIM